MSLTYDANKTHFPGTEANTRSGGNQVHTSPQNFFGLIQIFIFPLIHQN